MSARNYIRFDSPNLNHFKYFQQENDYHIEIPSLGSVVVNVIEVVNSISENRLKHACVLHKNGNTFYTMANIFYYPLRDSEQWQNFSIALNEIVFTLPKSVLGTWTKKIKVESDNETRLSVIIVELKKNSSSEVINQIQRIKTNWSLLTKNESLDLYYFYDLDELKRSSFHNSKEKILEILKDFVNIDEEIDEGFYFRIGKCKDKTIQRHEILNSRYTFTRIICLTQDTFLQILEELHQKNQTILYRSDQDSSYYGGYTVYFVEGNPEEKDLKYMKKACYKREQERAITDGAIATFFTKDDEGGEIHSLDYLDSRFLGGGTYGKVYKTITLVDVGQVNKESKYLEGAPLAAKYGDITNEVATLSTLWKRLRAKETQDPNYVFRGLQREPVAVTKNALDQGETKVMFSKLYQGSSKHIEPKSAYVRQLFRGLTHLPKVGIVNPDIKPSNIFIDEEREEAVIADFGLGGTFFDNHSFFEYVGKYGLCMTSVYGDLEIWLEIVALINQKEIMTSEEFEPKIMNLYFELEVFALGLSLFEWYTKKRPYPLKEIDHPIAKKIFKDKSKTPSFNQLHDINEVESNLVNELVNPKDNNSIPCDTDLAYKIFQMIHPDRSKRPNRYMLIKWSRATATK